MDFQLTPSTEQKMYVASVCPEFKPMTRFVSSSGKTNAYSCDVCQHWKDGKCGIFNEVLSSIDQT